jgi:enediyne biosynthesis protein E4
MHEMKQILLLIAFLFGLNTAQSQQTIFTEVGEESGLDYIYPGNEFQMAGGGVMVIDVNNDGWEDLYQSGGVFNSKLWLNQKGTFVDATEAYGLDTLNGYFIQGAISADYDNDGFTDFIIANYGKGIGRGDKRSPVLMHNEKGTHFRLVDLSNVLPPGNYASACWGDFNKDGFVDVYLTNYVSSMGGIRDSNGVEIGYDPVCFENVLLLNEQGKGFRECAADYGLNDPGCGLAASFTDIDNDGDLDLLLLNDFGIWTGIGNKCFRNNYPEPSFTDITEETNFGLKMYGMGIGQGDYDQDGNMEYYITNIGQNYLLKYENGIFTDKAMDLGIDLTFVRDTIRGTSWSGLFFDMDFDGDLDLYVSKGNVAALVPKTSVKDPNVLFENRNGQFIRMSDTSGVNDPLSHRGSVVFDYDHDGDLDIVSSVVKLPWGAFAKMDQKIKLFRNDQEVGNWIAVKLTGLEDVNRDCFGCKVIFEQDGERMAREVDAASGQASQSTRLLYYGLGDRKELELLEVKWANGKSNKYEKLKAGKIYEIKSNGRITEREL